MNPTRSLLSVSSSQLPEIVRYYIAHPVSYTCGAAIGCYRDTAVVELIHIILFYKCNIMKFLFPSFFEFKLVKSVIKLSYLSCVILFKLSY